MENNKEKLRQKELKNIWEKFSLEELLTAGLENDKISSSDIIDAVDIYKDPNRICEDADIDFVVENAPIDDIVDKLDRKYGTEDILDCLDKYYILNYLSDEDMLDHLEGSWVLDDHDSTIREFYQSEVLDDIEDKILEQRGTYLESINQFNYDQLRQFFCKLFGISNYDEDGLFVGFNYLIDKLNKSTYKNKNDNKWQLIRE